MGTKENIQKRFPSLAALSSTQVIQSVAKNLHYLVVFFLLPKKSIESVHD
jgi:hypothetical protein